MPFGSGVPFSEMSPKAWNFRMGPSILRLGLFSGGAQIQVWRTGIFFFEQKREGISVGRDRRPDFILFTKTVTHEV